MAKHEFQPREFTSETVTEAAKVRAEVNSLRYIEAQLRLQASYFAWKTAPTSTVTAAQKRLRENASKMKPEEFAIEWAKTIEQDSARSKLHEDYLKARKNFEAFFPKTPITEVTAGVDRYITERNSTAQVPRAS